MRKERNDGRKRGWRVVGGSTRMCFGVGRRRRESRRRMMGADAEGQKGLIPVVRTSSIHRFLPRYIVISGGMASVEAY
jgi:hypothetical protein